MEATRQPKQFTGGSSIDDSLHGHLLELDAAWGQPLHAKPINRLRP